MANHPDSHGGIDLRGTYCLSRSGPQPANITKVIGTCDRGLCSLEWGLEFLDLGMAARGTRACKTGWTDKKRAAPMFAQPLYCQQAEETRWLQEDPLSNMYGHPSCRPGRPSYRRAMRRCRYSSRSSFRPATFRSIRPSCRRVRRRGGNRSSCQTCSRGCPC